MYQFSELFSMFRFKSGLSKAVDFGRELAGEGFIFEDSTFSKWKNGSRVPRDRNLILAIISVFVRKGGVVSLDDANSLLMSLNQRALNNEEKSRIVSKLVASDEIIHNSEFAKTILIDDTLQRALEKRILSSLDFNCSAHAVVNDLLSELGYRGIGYRVVVLTLIDRTNDTLKRITISDTREAKLAMSSTPVPFHKIAVPLNSVDNILSTAVRDRKPYGTSYWPNLFAPVLTNDQSIFCQKTAGIKSSLAFPLIVEDKSIGGLIFSLIKNLDEVTSIERQYLSNFCDVVAIALNNAMTYSSLYNKFCELRDVIKT